MPENRSTLCIYRPAIHEYFADDAVSAGGAERQLRLLSEHFTDHFDVHFIVHDNGQEPVITKDGYRFYRAHEPHAADDPFVRIKQIYSIVKALRRSNPDIVLCRGGIDQPIIVQKAARCLRARFVYDVANDGDITKEYDEAGLLRRKLFASVVSGSEAIIVQNSRQKSIIQNKFSEESTQIPNGYPETTDKKTEPGEYFLWVGRLEREQKQPHKFLELADKLPEFEFLLVGPHSSSQPYKEQLDREINQLSNVEYVGPVSPEEVHEYYNRAIAVVNTSQFEGFPNTYLEAWRKGVPVVSLHVDPNRFLNSQSDYFCSGGDIEDLVDICGQLGENPRLQLQLGKSCFEQYKSNYTMTTIAKRYVTVLRSCL